MKRFLSSWKVRLGLALLGFFFAVALFADPFLSLVLKADPRAVNYDRLGVPPGPDHLLGTTLSGQDVLTQLLAGARGSVLVGLTAGIVAVTIAVLVGTWSGYCAGLIDRITMAVVNVLMTLPSLALLFIIAGYVRNAGLLLIALIIGLLEWPGSARVIRAQTLSLRNRDFTAALRAIGEKPWRIVTVEIAPHLGGIISAMFLRALVAGILAESSLAFLGIGNTGGISWGMMIGQAQQQGAILRGMWWWFLPPGLCIALVGFATAMVNFGLDEVTNPALDSRLMAATRRFNALRTRHLRAESGNRPTTGKVTQ